MSKTKILNDRIQRIYTTLGPNHFYRVAKKKKINKETTAKQINNIYEYANFLSMKIDCAQNT